MLHIALLSILPMWKPLFENINELTLNWNIDKKHIILFVADNFTSKNVCVRMIKDWFCERSLLPLSEKLFNVQSTSYISNIILFSIIIQLYHEMVYPPRDIILEGKICKTLKLFNNIH